MQKALKGSLIATNAHLTLFSSSNLNSSSSSSPTTSSGLMKALPLLRGSLATRTKVASVHLDFRGRRLLQSWGIDNFSKHLFHPPLPLAIHQLLKLRQTAFNPGNVTGHTDVAVSPEKQTKDNFRYDMRRENLNAVKSIWSTRAVTVEKGDAQPSP